MELAIANGIELPIVIFVQSQMPLPQIFFLWRPFLRDSKDEMVLELAVKAGCQSIITYNIRDFAGVEQFGLNLLKPSEFLRLIGKLP
jgi:predicted nucleic acid-binding protein